MTRVRPFPVLLLSVLLAACSSSTASLSPIEWQRVPGSGPGGSLLGPNSTPGSFDQAGNFTVTAFKDGNIVRLYYGGAGVEPGVPANCGGINDVHWRPGLATSTDGVNFTRVKGSATGGAILENGGAGEFDSFLTYRPFVLKDGTLYRLWYNGSTAPFNCPPGTLALNRRIGYAESANGVNFTKMNTGPGIGGSVLRLGPAGSIDEQQVGYIWVIKDTNDYKMYYSANDAGNFWRVALATSTDARTWTKVPGKLKGGAILDVGAVGSFDVACAYQPTVVKERDQLYRMWYRGCQTAGNPNGPSKGVIGYAESNDGITWVKVPQPGLFGAALTQGPPGAFDSVRRCM